MIEKRELIKLLTFDIADLTAALADEADIEYMRAEEDRNQPLVGQWTEEFHRQAFKDSNIAQIIVKFQGTRVGYINLVGITNSNNSLELARITVSEPGKGYGSSIIRAVQDLAFEVMKVHRLWLDVIDFNERAFGLYKFLGFVHEGTLRDVDYYQGRYHSMHILSILEEEYPALRDNRLNS